MRALLSVSDKRGVVAFAEGIQALGADLVATGGTHAALVQSGLAVTSVESLTGFPEILDGRVKTLHPAIHSGILAQRDNPDHEEQLASLGISPIDLVVCNLYPFQSAARQPGALLADVVEQIDIGGPAMIRAAAKNFTDVLVLTDPDDYPEALTTLAAGAVTTIIRRAYAVKAFAHTAHYDTTITNYLGAVEGSFEFPQTLVVSADKARSLRYGENPHQRAAAYRVSLSNSSAPSLLDAVQIGGKELSYNNLLDADTAWRAVSVFTEPATAIVKHMDPCGLATRSSLIESFQAALASDPVSAYGGIVALNRPVDRALAQAVASEFFEVIVAPGFTPTARQMFERKPRLILLELPNYPAPKQGAEAFALRQISGAILVQTPDDDQDDDTSWTVLTTRAPTSQERMDLVFAWKVARFVRSNAIVIVRDFAVLGIGGGQPNRRESVGMAINRAGERARGAVLASDAFFPFADGLILAADAGITAVVQPGGSVRDDEVIAAANAAGIAMLATGIRHFRH